MNNKINEKSIERLDTHTLAKLTVKRNESIEKPIQKKMLPPHKRRLSPVNNK